MRRLVSMFQPRIVLVSDRPPSARSLLSARGFSLGMGSEAASRRHRVWIASGVADDNLGMAFGVSGPMITISSM